MSFLSAKLHTSCYFKKKKSQLKCKNLKVYVLETYHATEIELLSSLSSFTVISMISLPDFSDGDRELLSITVSMQT